MAASAEAGAISRPLIGLTAVMRRLATGDLAVDIGHRDRANAGAIVRLVCESSDIPSAMIGRITMDHNVSSFEVQEQVAAQVLDGLHAAMFDGRPVRVRDAAAPAGGPRDEIRRPRSAPPAGHPPRHSGRRGQG